MFKVININNFDGITCDSTMITCDSDIITVDATQSDLYEFKVPYRFFSDDVRFIIYDESNDIEIEMELQAVEVNNYMLFNFYFDFEDDKTYESKITDMSDKLIWRGKIYATLQTDLQNYSINKTEREV